MIFYKTKINSLEKIIISDDFIIKFYINDLYKITDL
jgi:hypothetical protein